jgi:hypothetical protein
VAAADAGDLLYGKVNYFRMVIQDLTVSVGPLLRSPPRPNGECGDISKGVFSSRFHLSTPTSDQL